MLQSALPTAHSTPDSAASKQVTAPPRLLRPGVAWMARLRFPTKALLISLVFLLPIIVLCHQAYRSFATQRSFNQGELDGIAVLQSFAPLTGKLVVVRGATRAMLGGLDLSAEYQQHRREVDTLLRQLDAQLQQADPLKLRAEFDALRQAWEATAQAPNGLAADGKNTVFVPLTAAAARLLQLIADRSGLMQDPDIDSFYLAVSAVQDLPDLQENLGVVRSWGAYLAGRNEHLSATERLGVQLRFKGYETTVQSRLRSLKDNLAKVAQVHPALARQLPLDFLLRAERYRAAVSRSVLEGREGSAAMIWADGLEPTEAVAQVYDKLLPTLHGLIAQRQATLHQEQLLLASLTLVALLLAAYLFYSFYWSTCRGLDTITEHLSQIAHGDLRTPPAPPMGRDELAQVIHHLRTTFEALQLLIRKMHHSVGALHTAANEIADASSDLAGRTETVVALLEEQASTMEEIGATVRATAQQAQAASNFATDNARVAEKGGQVFEDVANTMRDIQASSSQISEIIGAIDGIAFQTSILALNAAVEAARAGESGRGFAVVASEVRSLAGRSASAAQEIKKLITTSVDKVEGGSRVVQAAGDTLTEVVVNASKIHTFLSEISVASRDQATGVAEAGQAISDLDRHTQQNAALVEQTSAAASTLRHQADLLQAEVAAFKVT